ncbi:MAG: nucleotidyltransferase domain-containing protein [Actinomycetota bacterium]
MVSVRQHSGLKVMIEAIAGHALAGQRQDRGLLVPEETWPSLLRELYAERLTGLAVEAVESGRVDLSDTQWAELIDRQRTAMLWALALEKKLFRLAPAFERAGVDLVVLKGPSLAHTVYPDPSWRPFGDLDLLVRTKDWRRACEILEEHGFHRRLPEPRPGFDERFGKAAVHRDEQGIDIDLHRTLVLGPFGLWIEPEVLFDRAVPLSLGGRAFRRLDDTSLLLHVCMHAVLGFEKALIMPLRDVMQVAQQGDVDWQELHTLARKWKLRAVVHRAFLMAATTLSTEWKPPALEVGNETASRRELKALSAYVTERRGRGGTARATLLAIPGVRPKLAYVLSLVAPRREFLAARTGGRGSYVRRWRVAASWLRRRRS